MRTIDRMSSTAAISWVRGEAGRMRRAMMAQRPAVRLALVLAPVLLLTAVGYWVAGTLAASGPRYLAQERAFSSEDLLTIRRNFDGKGISYRVVDRKVAVAADQYDQAVALLAKLDIGPRPIDEIREWPDSLATLLDTQDDKERRDRLQTEKIIERIIDDLEGVVRSMVRIHHPRPRLPRNARVRPSAFVRLECEPNRLLPLQTVQAIPKILTNSDPELSADAITVMDLSGRLLLDPTNPELGKLNRVRAREQELRDRVAEQLAWIPGVRITVDLTDRGVAIQAPAAQARPGASGPGVGARGGPSPSISVNQPAELGEPEPPPPPGPAPVEKVERGRVFVYVPRSHYFRMMLPRPDDREPSVTELHQVAVKTRERIEGMVKPVIPGSCTLEVDTIPDDVPMTRAAALPAGSDHRRITADWGIIGAAAAAVALVMALGSWIQARRRPARAIAAPSAGRRYREDAADEPEPSERVRELVRRDPEVAASVLQRWATQGGPVS
jgi:hypothetical protein